MAPRRSLVDVMKEKEVSDHYDLAIRSGISEPTAEAAVYGKNQTRRNTSTGRKIADALGVSVDDINWPGGGLTNSGRPAGTGGKYTKRSD